MRNFLILSAIIALPLTYSPTAQAQLASQPDELEAIYACKLLSGATERLSCYDKAVGRFEAAQKKGDVVTISKNEVKKVEQEAFGFNIPSLPKFGKILGLGKSDKKDSSEKSSHAAISDTDTANTNKRVTYSDNNEISAVAMEIEKITKFDAIKKRFYFKNGQVWEQTTGSELNLPKAPWTAEITKGALGGYKLKVNGKGWKVKVRRIK